MISTFDTADEAIEKTINALCSKLDRYDPTTDKFAATVDAIAKLRASQNPIIQETKK